MEYNPAADRDEGRFITGGDQSRIWEETIKRLLVGALVGLAVSFVVPTFSQRKETVDPQIFQVADAIAASHYRGRGRRRVRGRLPNNKKYVVATNNHDAATIGALHTEDAVLLMDTGPIYGRAAIEKCFAADFKMETSPEGRVPTLDIRRYLSRFLTAGNVQS